MKKSIIIILLLIIVYTQNLIAQADVNKHSILTSKFKLGLGMYIPTESVQFKTDGNSENQGIQFDETFDFNNNHITPDINFDWRFSKNWKLAAEFFDIKYDTTAVLENDIKAGDYLFNKGSSVSIGYKINMYRVYLGRIISRGFKHELGAGIGLHVLDLEPFIKGNVIVNGSDNEFRIANVSATAPLPNIALWYYFAPTEKWAFTAHVDWFGLIVDQYSGSLWDVSPRVHYQIIKNLGVAVDYRFFDVWVKVSEKNWNGSVNLSLSGPTITFIGNL